MQNVCYRKKIKKKKKNPNYWYFTCLKNYNVNRNIMLNFLSVKMYKEISD